MVAAGARGALFAAGERGACGARGGAVFVAGGARGALLAVVRARGAACCPLGTSVAEFLAREHPCGIGAAHSGIIVLFGCRWPHLDGD